MDDEWDRYVADKKYARSLRNNAEAGHVRGLMLFFASVAVIVAGTVAIAYGALAFGIWIAR